MSAGRIVYYLFVAAFLGLGVMLITATAAQSTSLGQSISLEAAISDLAGRPISITVDTEQPGSWGGGAWTGLPFIYIGRDAYTDAEEGGGRGLMVLLHELGHTTGIKNEAAANCYALRNLLPFLTANWEPADVWLHTESKAYTAAVGFMRAQSAVYQCGAA